MENKSIVILNYMNFKRLKAVYTLLFSLCLVIANAQEVSYNDQIDWSKAGCSQTILSSNKIDFKVEQQANPTLSNNDLIDQIKKSIGKDGGTIYFPNGTYYFNRTIKLISKISLVGENRDSVKFIFDNKGKGDLIALKGRLGVQITPTTDLEQRNNVLMTDPSKFNLNEVVYVYDNDEKLITNSWAHESTGQIFRITDIQDDRITLSNKSRRSFLLSNQFSIRKITPIENCHIKNLSITRTDHTDFHTSNIFMDYATNCSVENVKSYKCSYSHIALEKSLNCSVSNCILSESLKYGNGGNGYGVVVQFGTSDCKIENNCFCTLRHSMLAQCGANGNVFINNISKNPYWTGTLLPPHSAGDIVLHGNYPYSNLFKGNQCQHIVIDNSHGLNGPNNQFIENELESYGIHMNKDSGDGMLFINNKITGKRLKGHYRIKGKNHIEKGNLKRGVECSNK